MDGEAVTFVGVGHVSRLMLLLKPAVVFGLVGAVVVLSRVLQGFFD